MLRNQQQNKQILTHLLLFIKQQRLIHNTILCNKTSDIMRQGNIMKKLFNHRVSGSKKRWIPSTMESANCNSIVKELQFGKTPSKGGKNDTRRMAVLNKLFMGHITDLMATGEISEIILGKSLQILRVKISQDFAYINVYWISGSGVCNDDLLEQELQRCSGLLRHELSQLCLMGVVPRVKFVKDKLFTNMNQVETLLTDMDFGSEDEQQEEICFQNMHNKAETLKQEFYGRKTDDIPAVGEQVVQENMPEMRHDVFGLDHKHIMFKILTKMRKSKQAWDQHLQKPSSELNNTNSIENASTTRTGSSIDDKLAKSAANSEKFEAFLAQRKERRNTPERKKFRASDHNVSEVNTMEDDYTQLMMSKRQCQVYEAEDYLLDDMENRRDK